MHFFSCITSTILNNYGNRYGKHQRSFLVFLGTTQILLEPKGASGTGDLVGISCFVELHMQRRTVEYTWSYFNISMDLYVRNNQSRRQIIFGLCQILAPV